MGNVQKIPAHGLVELAILKVVILPIYREIRSDA